jgi:RHS repeat-associated protein
VAQAGTSYTYNGDGVLVSDGTTTYAQDLAAPLSQVLTDGTANYVYGHERLRALGGPWYIGDALGSVRQTLDDAGAVLGSVQYDPWGVPTAGTPQPFGFTGELHRAGQVYLRARWYAPGQGRFVSEDPFAGFLELPYSLHAYQYGYSNPVRWTDPSGRHPDPARRRLTTLEETIIQAIIQVDYARSYIGLDVVLNFPLADTMPNIPNAGIIPIVNFSLHEFYSIAPSPDYMSDSSVLLRIAHVQRKAYMNANYPPDWTRSGNNYNYPSPISARYLASAQRAPTPRKTQERVEAIAAKTRRIIALWPVVAGSGYNPDIDGHWAIVAWQSAIEYGLIEYTGIKLTDRDRRLAKQPVPVYIPEEIMDLLGQCPPLEPAPEGEGYQRPLPLPPGIFIPNPGSTSVHLPGGNPYPPRRHRPF